MMTAQTPPYCLFQLLNIYVLATAGMKNTLLLSFFSVYVFYVVDVCFLGLLSPS